LVMVTCMGDGYMCGRCLYVALEVPRQRESSNGTLYLDSDDVQKVCEK